MNLWGHVASIWVEDQSNITLMIWIESKKYSATQLCLPFWDFTTLLDIERSTPHVNIFKLVTGKFSSSEDISRRDFLGIGNVIVNIGGITSSRVPQV